MSRQGLWWAFRAAFRSACKAALDDEEGRLEVGERRAQLVDFGGRAMELKAGKIRHGEHLAEQPAHVFQMCQDSRRPGVTFAAEDLVFQGGEFIKTAVAFGAGFFHKSGQQGLNLRQPPGMRFEIRMQGDEIGRNGHDRERGQRERGNTPEWVELFQAGGDEVSFTGQAGLLAAIQLDALKTAHEGWMPAFMGEPA